MKLVQRLYNTREIAELRDTATRAEVEAAALRVERDAARARTVELDALCHDAALLFRLARDSGGQYPSAWLRRYDAL